jgi:hypothetical protein
MKSSIFCGLVPIARLKIDRSIAPYKYRLLIEFPFAFVRLFDCPGQRLFRCRVPIAQVAAAGKITARKLFRCRPGKNRRLPPHGVAPVIQVYGILGFPVPCGQLENAFCGFLCGNIGILPAYTQEFFEMPAFGRKAAKQNNANIKENACWPTG